MPIILLICILASVNIPMSAQSVFHDNLTTHCGRFPVKFEDAENASYIIGGMFPLHFYKDGEYKYNSPGLMWVEAMRFALQEINNSTTLLPGVKLGYKIYDSCNTISIAVESALQLTQGFKPYKENKNGTCPCATFNKAAIGLVGDASSDTTTRVAAILAASRTTQISYSATSTDLSARHLYPSFLRTIPPDDFQALLVRDLMKKFKWKYINIVASDDNYGRVGINELLPQLKSFNICVAINEVYDIKNDINGTYTNKVIQKLKNEKEATVIVLWCQRPEAETVLRAAQQFHLYDRTWIATETYGKSSNLYKYNERVVKGMFGIIPAQLSYLPFINHLKTITPNAHYANPWLAEYWIKKQSCKQNGEKNFTCSAPINLSTLPTNKYVNVMDSVYAIAHGLQNYITAKKVKPDEKIIPGELLEFVKEVNFTSKSEIAISFNHLGNPGDATYSVTNLQYNSTTKTLRHVEVGLWNFMNRDIVFSGKIQFANESKTVPRSSCQEHCYPGYKGLTFGDRPCCWKCVQCPPGEIQPNHSQSSCFKCTGNLLPNSNQSKCIEPVMQYLQPKKTQGALLISFMVIGCVLIISTLVIFSIHKATPIVRAANKSLTLLQLVSMMFIFALPLLCFQSTPTVTTCAARLYYFVAFYSIAVSVTFTKADRLLRIFKASKSGILTKRSTMKGNKVQFITVAVLTIIGLLLCTVIYLPFRPVIEHETKYINNGDIHVWHYCSGYNDSILFILIGYIAIIALICGVYAFKARKLPETHNEARYTSFAMFTFLLVWLMFVPIYFSTKSKVDRIAIWGFISFIATIALYVTTYVPKLYIILFKPDENTAERFREKLKQQAIGNTVNSSNTNTSNNISKSGTLDAPKS